MRTTFKIAVIVLAIFSTQAFSQIDQTLKPKAYIFDEFGTAAQKEWKERIAKYRTKLEELSRSPVGDVALLVFYGENFQRIRQSEVFVRDNLFRDCRDCFGFDGPRLTFVNLIAKKSKVQFWIIPVGADSPVFVSSRKIEEFGKLSKSKFSQLLDWLQKQYCPLDENPIYAIVYGPKREANNFSRNFLDGVVKLRCGDPPRVTITYGGYRAKLRTELWIVPPGADPPSPEK